MKKIILFFIAIFFLGFYAQANPGDTTWVQANIAQLSWNGNYDTIAVFPPSSSSTTYRRIYMVFTLGKYVCPGSPQYCGDWDYTVDNYIMTKNGDTLDLGRMITPYANAGAPRTPWAWTQRYIYDVTDFYPVLKDSALIRISYSGYSGGFTADIKFAFIEGTPDRNVTGIKRLWNGYFGYGGATNTMNSHFPTVNETAPTNTQNANLNFIVTGHGSDANGCCEFMSHYYKVLQNNTQLDSTNIWRADCGSNELYPQSGTWVYDRANWCPGALVNSHNHPLTGVSGGTNFDAAIQFDSTYTSNGGGGYGCFATLFYYAAWNKTLDASLDDIIAPTNFEGYYKENPICGKPTIRVKNAGTTTITTINFDYGIKDSTLQSYTWTGSLAQQQSVDISLPELNILNDRSLANDTGTAYTFIAKIMNVNGGADADNTNDILTSKFKASPTWPQKFYLFMTTNNQTASGFAETSWQILDMSNNVVKQRVNLAASTTYKDTVSLPKGCYKLVATDKGCDGLHWWAYPTGVTSGTLYARTSPTGIGNLPLHGNNFSGTYAYDFGCGFVHYFTTVGVNNSVSNISEIPLAIEAYPNPANSAVNITISGMTNVKGQLILIDALGRVVLQKACNAEQETLNIGGFVNGIYTLVYEDANANKLQTRLLIAR